MSIRAGLFRIGRTLPRTSHRHPNPQTRLFPPLSRSVVFIRDNEVVHSKFQSYLDTLKKSSGQLNVIHQYYPALSWEVSQASSRNLSDSSSPSQEIDGTRIQDMLSREEFEVMLESLAASGNAVDLQLIEDILSDMVNVFQVSPDSQTHSVIIRGLIQRKNLQTVHRWLQNMSKKPGNITPTSEHYHLLLEACPEFASIKFMRNLVQSMWKTGLLPDVETYKIFLRGAWIMTSGKPPAPAVIAPVLTDMRDAGIPYDPDFLHFVQSLYLAAGLTKYAHDVVAAYNSVYESALTPEKVLENRWIPQLSDPAQSLKIRLKAYHDYVKEGGSPSSNIFNALLRGCCTISQMERIANTLDMDPTAQNWSSLIANSMKRGRVDDAFVAYGEAVAVGIQPDASFVGPFLKEIFGSDKVPSKALADRGLSIYSDFCSNASAETSSLDLEIHQMMLGALTKLPKIEEYSDITEDILKELKARNVPMHDIAASIIVTDMNGASDPAEALEAYKAYRIALDGQGYEKVLEAFCRFYLQQNLKVPPLTTYFSIVKDMKAAGFPATSSIYTILLRLLGQAGTLARRRAEYHMIADSCITTTKRVHDLITLESSIVPDAILWNQLLDTYSRLDCNADVLRLWDQMYMSRQYDNVSVSVVFDTCRRIRSLQRIQQTYEQLRREKFKLTLNNWNSYIEALCSVGDLNTALKAICLDMSLNGVKPEVYTANLILHQEALKKTQLRTEMFKRIKRHQPELYNELVLQKFQSSPKTEDRKDLES